MTDFAMCWKCANGIRGLPDKSGAISEMFCGLNFKHGNSLMNPPPECPVLRREGAE